VKQTVNVIRKACVCVCTEASLSAPVTCISLFTWPLLARQMNRKV